MPPPPAPRPAHAQLSGSSKFGSCGRLEVIDRSGRAYRSIELTNDHIKVADQQMPLLNRSIDEEALLKEQESSILFAQRYERYKPGSGLGHMCGNEPRQNGLMQHEPGRTYLGATIEEDMRQARLVHPDLMPGLTKSSNDRLYRSDREQYRAGIEALDREQRWRARRADPKSWRPIVLRDREEAAGHVSGSGISKTSSRVDKRQ